MRKYIKQRETTERGYALLLSIILLTVLAALVAVMSLNAISNLRSATTVRDATYFDVATASAVSDAIRMANNPASGEVLSAHIGKSNAVFGEVDGTKQYQYRWYLMPVNNTYADLTYDLHVTGYRGGEPDNPNTSRNLTVRITSIPTSGARWVGDTVFYRPTSVSVFSWGVFGADAVTLNNTTQLSSFNSVSGATGMAGDSVGTNGTLTTSSGTRASRITMMNSYPGHSSTSRCTGALCNTTDIVAAPYGIDLSVVNEWVQDACPSGAGSYPSVSGNTITINAKEPNCFNNVSLSGNVNINYVNGQPSSGRPAKIYIKGNLNLGVGTSFNNASNSSISGAMILHTYVSGSTVQIGATGSGSTTDVRMLLATSDNTICNVGSASRTTHFWGSAVCGRITTSGTVRFNWDEQINAIAGDERVTQRIWSTSGYSNAY